MDCVYLPGGKVREGQYEPQTPWIYLEPYRSQGSFCLQYLLSVDMRQIRSLAPSTSVQIPCLSVDFTHALMALFFFFKQKLIALVSPKGISLNNTS